MKNKVKSLAILAWAVLLVLALTATSSQDANAKSFYLNDFNAAYGTAGLRIDTCGVCHYDFNGGQAKNMYGEAFLASGHNFAAIAGDDSDGDGTINASEIDVFRTLPGLACADLVLLSNAPPDVGDYMVPGTVCEQTSCVDHQSRNACRNDTRCEWIGNPKNGYCQELPCEATEMPEVSCADGIDNDCDGLTDTDDPDCFGQGVGCDATGCHQGIENVAPAMNFACTQCHQGNGNTSDKVAAHSGMYANPSDLRVIDQTCAACHLDKVDNAKKSLHATMAGMIGATRYDWGVQDRASHFGTYDISDDDGIVPPGAVGSLTKIPRYDPGSPDGFNNSPADDYLRNQCLRCHLWSGGHERAGDYRNSGCAACHMVYNDDGRYTGGDQAILACQDDPACMESLGRKAFPRLHQLTPKIPEFQCIHCHNRGGRTGVSFIGTMESDAYGSPWTATGGKQPQLHGKNYNHLSADIHYERGMSCIDCHTGQDLMGDGNIWQKKEQAVEIECTDCHGTIDQISTGQTSWGNPLPNIVVHADQTVALTSKLYGTQHNVPQIANATPPPPSMGHTAMRGVAKHMEVLECYGCHARWTPQCYGCHAKQDLRSTGRDWIDPLENTTDPTKTAKKAAADASQLAYGWSETRSYLRWETPVIGINATTEGNLVAPFIPGCQVFFTQIGQDGNAIIHNQTYTTVDGTSGIAQNPIQPHTISDRPRRCEDCHNNTKALGLGTGTYVPFFNLLPISFELERIVDETGTQIQATNHEGARPFNAVELEAMQMNQLCTDCHTNGIP
jgi:hypothetical protein